MNFAGTFMYLYPNSSELEGKEKTMWVSKWESGEANREDVEDRMDKCGKIVILSNTDLEPMEIYSIYKSRMCIEETIKRLKGYLHLDRTYMQSDEALDGWLFITMRSLQCRYWIMERLAESGLLRKYSVIDVMWELRKIRKEPWIDGWHLRPLTRKQRTIIEKLNLKEVIGIKWGVWAQNEKNMLREQKNTQQVDTKHISQSFIGKLMLVTKLLGRGPPLKFPWLTGFDHLLNESLKQIE